MHQRLGAHFLSILGLCRLCAALSLQICIIHCRSSTGCSRLRRSSTSSFSPATRSTSDRSVDFRAQILVVKKYLTLLSGVTRVILCSGNHDLDERSAEGEKIARWIGEVRELGIACDGDSLTISRYAFHGVSMVGRTTGQEPHRKPASRGRRRTAAAMDLGASRAAGEFPDQLGRQAVLRRRRTGAVDQAITSRRW